MTLPLAFSLSLSLATGCTPSMSRCPCLSVSLCVHEPWIHVCRESVREGESESSRFSSFTHAHRVSVYTQEHARKFMLLPEASFRQISLPLSVSLLSRSFYLLLHPLPGLICPASAPLSGERIAFRSVESRARTHRQADVSDAGAGSEAERQGRRRRLTRVHEEQEILGISFSSHASRVNSR